MTTSQIAPSTPRSSTDALTGQERSANLDADELSRLVGLVDYDQSLDPFPVIAMDAVVFVCGNAATIAPGVRAALAQIFRDKTSTGAADAEAWLAGLRATNRFVEDIWGG